MAVIGKKIVLRFLFLQQELRSLAARQTVEIIVGTVSQLSACMMLAFGVGRDARFYNRKALDAAGAFSVDEILLDSVGRCEYCAIAMGRTSLLKRTDCFFEKMF